MLSLPKILLHPSHFTLHIFDRDLNYTERNAKNHLHVLEKHLLVYWLLNHAYNLSLFMHNLSKALIWNLINV